MLSILAHMEGKHAAGLAAAGLYSDLKGAHCNKLNLEFHPEMIGKT